MQYQTVIIELSDGSIGTFTGPALIFPDGSENPPTIVGMKFTEPHKLTPADIWTEFRVLAMCVDEKFYVEANQ